MNIELSCCTEVLINHIQDKRVKRKFIAKLYALAIQSSETVDWKEVNKAIIDRWSVSALQYIKNSAWSGGAFSV